MNRLFHLQKQFPCLDSAALLLLNNNRFTCVVEFNPSKQEVRRTMILPLLVSEYSLPCPIKNWHQMKSWRLKNISLQTFMNRWMGLCKNKLKLIYFCPNISFFLSFISFSFISVHSFILSFEAHSQSKN